MIKLLRSETPKVFHSDQFKRHKLHAYNFFKSNNSTRAQIRFDFKEMHVGQKEIIGALTEMSLGKCFYCETSLATHVSCVDYFRPNGGAIGLERGDYSLDHYWWLAFEWENYYLSCSHCSQSKGSRFPVLGQRVKILGVKNSLKKEKILILDPCGDIDPGEHLSFNEKGEVEGKTIIGRNSINVFGLNRRDLVETRRKEIDLLYRDLREVFLNLNNISDKVVRDYSHPGLIFSQMRRQVIKLWLSNPNFYLNRSSEKSFQMIFNPLVVPAFKKVEAIGLKFQPVELKVYSREEESSIAIKAQYDFNEDFLKAHLVERIEIQDFKSIEKLNIDLLGNSKNKTSWLMLLGENGVGKTSVLQAVSLALASEESITKLNLLPEKFIRRATNVNEAIVRVFLSGEKDPIILNIKENIIQRSILPKNLILLSYGSVRFFDHSEDSGSNLEQSCIENLFIPTKKLHGINAWLADLTDEGFNLVARAFRDILDLGTVGEFVRVNGSVYFKRSDITVDLMQLSDGYQSLIAMSGHLMMHLLRIWPSIDVAEGIVLVDEIGIHMHPTWKMRIVSSMRVAFPRVQFICTTHDPLCLRGLDDNEVEVLEYLEIYNKVEVKKNLPPISGMKIDQILMSEHFGLNSTTDPSLEIKFQEYYRLLSSKKKTRKIIEHINELQREIDNSTVLGMTRRERMALQLIDEYIAEAESARDKDSLELRNKTKDEVLKLIKGGRSLD